MKEVLFNDLSIKNGGSIKNAFLIRLDFVFSRSL